MAKEALYFPEEYTQHLINVIRQGLYYERHHLPQSMIDGLTEWCDEMDEYLEQQ